ncbi:MAG: DUF882 domain-containing protein, partial [Rhizobiaceae bacterium]
DSLQKARGLLSSFLKAVRIVPAAAAMLCAMTFAASAETRTLKIYHVHLNERSVITYKRNGKYLPDGLNKLNRALRDWRRNEPTKMDPRLFDVVWESYKRSGATGYINVIGGYRSAATNSMLRKRSKGVAQKSQHVLGRAMDFYIPGVSLKKLRNAGLQAQAGGVGYYPSSGSPFVHMDVGNIRHWPRLSRKELMAVFPNGKTVHVPTDGKPLPGYELALAASKSRKSGTAEYASSSSGGSGKSLLAILFGGGADEEEDTGASEEVAVAAASPKPAAKRATAEPVEPLPLPESPAQPAIVAALPRRDQAEGVEPPRPDADLTSAEAPEALAFAVPLPQKKPKFAAVTAQETSPEQAEIAAAIAASNATPAPVAVVASADPAAEAAAIRDALGQDAATAEVVAGQDTLFAGAVPVPGKKPKTPDVLLASVAIPQPRPQIEGEAAVDAASAELASTELAAAEIASEDVALAMASGDVPVPSSPETIAQEAAEIVASVDSQKGNRQPDASLRTAMLEDANADVTAGVKTTGKSAKPKSTDAKPAMKAVAKAPTPKVGKFALSNTPVKIANQPVAPEYAQALIRAAPSEVLVAGFTKEGPLTADKFSGKAVNFLRVARFENSN